jgi:hypothetical protein
MYAAQGRQDATRTDQNVVRNDLRELGLNNRLICVFDFRLLQDYGPEVYLSNTASYKEGPIHDCSY